MTYSKLLCEYIITDDVNDQFKVQDSAAAWQTVTLTAGRYRDHIALAADMQTQLDAATAAGTGQTWTVSVSNTTGIITISSDDTWDIDWNTAAWGTTLRDDLGYDGTETVVLEALTASDTHLGGFYPTEPVEADNRPDTDGADRWSSDTYQQQGVTGLVVTTGGGNRISTRSIQFLLPQDDLSAFETWLQRVAEGYSFAYYHDRTQTWSGPSSEYAQYKALADEGGNGVVYDPEPVDPSNTIWHRQQLLITERVAPTV